MPLLPLKPNWCHVISSRNTGQQAVLKFVLPLELLPLLATSLLEPSLTRSRQPSRSRDFWWLVISELTTSFLIEVSVNLLTSTLCNTDSLLHYMGIANLCNKEAYTVGCWTRKSCACMALSHEHPWAVMPDLYFSRDSEEFEEKEQDTTEKAVT